MVKILHKNENINRPPKILNPFLFHRKSLKYQKLPLQLLKLSVLKLDGSSFSFNVARNATIAKLKMAIEEQFSLSENGDGKVLWPLVWSHFCLCYGGQKLINEKANIKNYGIKDGDQLHFIHHLRIDHAAAEHKCSNHHPESRKCRMSGAPATRLDDHDRGEDQDGDLKYFHHEEHLAFPMQKVTLAQSWKELLLCSKFPVLKLKHGNKELSFTLLS